MTSQIYMKKIIQIITLSLYILQANGEGISCFRCFVSQPGNENDLLCSHFNGSAKYQVHCPSSTLCMKKTIYFQSQDSVRKVVQRDCAAQKDTSPIYNDIDKKWYKQETVVKTAYEEGCFIGEDKGTAGGPPEYCFCSFHLCNSSLPVKLMNKNNIFLLTVMLLALRSMQSFFQHMSLG